MRRDSLLAVKLLWSFVQVLSDRLRNTNEALSDLKRELDVVRKQASDAINDATHGLGSGGRTTPPFGQ
jgi:hypothetical protein